MTIIAGSMESFRGYAQFKDSEEFNRHVEMWLDNSKYDFTKSELIALKRLIRFSVKYNGIANAKIGTMLKAIYELDTAAGISRATFKRMLAKAKQLGMLVTLDTTKQRGGQSSNLYIFQRFPRAELDELLNEKKLSHLNKASNPSEKEVKSKEQKERIETAQLNRPVDKSKHFEEKKGISEGNGRVNPVENHKNPAHITACDLTKHKLDHTYTNDKVPARFCNLVSCYVNDAAIIEEYWRMARHAAYIHVLEKDDEYLLTTAIDAFKQMIGSLKKGRVRKPVAYFYGVMYNKCGKALYEQLNEQAEQEKESAASAYPGIAAFKEMFGNPYGDDVVGM